MFIISFKINTSKNICDKTNKWLSLTLIIFILLIKLTKLNLIELHNVYFVYYSFVRWE